MKVRGAALAVLVVATSVLGNTGHAAALTKVKVTIAALSTNYAPLFNAIEQGYYKDEGLDVAIVKAGGGIGTPALLSGRVQFSTSAASAFSAILKGAPLKIVLTEADRPTYQLWTTQPDLKTIQSLKGKTVGIQTRGDTFEIWTRLVLRSHGMSGDAVSYTPLGFGSSARLAAVKSGSLPAVVLSSIDAATLRNKGMEIRGHLLEDAMKDNIRMLYNGVATSDALIKDNPDLVLRFIRATLKGMRFMTVFRNKSITNLINYSKTGRRATTADYDDVVRTLTKDGTVPLTIQELSVEVQAEVVKLPKSQIPPLDKMFDYSFVRKANASLDAQGWKPAM